MVRVTSFCDLKSPSFELVTPSLNYTLNAILKSRDSKLVTLISTLLRKKQFFLSLISRFYSGTLQKYMKSTDLVTEFLIRTLSLSRQWGAVYELTNISKNLRLALKKLERGVHNNKISMVPQNFVIVTSFCVFRSQFLELVKPSLNCTINAVLKSRYSKLVTLICPFMRKILFS